MFALFKNNKFIGFSEEIPPQPDISHRKIPENQKNLRLWHWVGSYENGRMEHRDPQAALTLQKEREIFEKIDLKYPLTTQLHLIIKQLYNLSIDSTKQDAAFLDMAEMIIDAIDNQEKRIKYYSQTNEYSDQRPSTSM